MQKMIMFSSDSYLPFQNIISFFKINVPFISQNINNLRSNYELRQIPNNFNTEKAPKKKFIKTKF